VVEISSECNCGGELSGKSKKLAIHVSQAKKKCHKDLDDGVLIVRKQDNIPAQL
jgi:hypothetical protein